MKRIFTFGAAVFVLSCFVSCDKKDDTSESGPLFTHSFSIEAQLPELEQEVDVRGSLGSFVSASWTKGDKLSVVNLSTGKVLSGTLQADASGTVVPFSGTVVGTIASGDRISLFYPAIENLEGKEIGFTPKTISVASQSKSSGVPLVATSTFTAESASGEFSNKKLYFDYGISYLKLNLANLPESSTVSKVTLRNFSNSVTYSIDTTNKEFVISTDEEKAAKGLIELTGPFDISDKGALSVRLAVVAADNTPNRMVEVSVTDDGEYSSTFSSDKLVNNKYYNTIVSTFEKTGLAGVDAYGVYCLSSNQVIDQYVGHSSTMILGTEGDEKDFTVIQSTSSSFWTIKGLPATAQEGDSFTARFLSNKVEGFPSGNMEGAKVFRVVEDGAFSKLWVTAHKDDSDYLFIIRK